jgi:O-methyltransferase
VTIPSPATRQLAKDCQHAALCRPDILWATYYTARQLLDQGIPGDLVECGVFAGAHPAMMARAIMDDAVAQRQRISRRVHLFDSFAGVPAPGDQDEGITGSALQTQTTCSLKQCQRYLEDWGIPEKLLVFHVGWYSDVLPNIEQFPIALLRLDCDLYSSIKLAIQYLHPWVVERGICVMDDYAFPGARLGFFEATSPGTISPIQWHRR